MDQQIGDAFAGRLDGHTPDVQETPVPRHEECQGTRSETPNPHKDMRGSTRKCKGHPSSLRPSSRAIWERALEGSQRNRQARRPPTSPQSTSQVRPGSAAQNPKGGINEGVRAHTRACDLRLLTTTSCSEASKRMQQQIEGAARRPIVLHTNMPSSRDRTRTGPDNQMHELAGPRHRTSGEYRDTEQQKHSQECRSALGKREGGKSRSGSLDVVDRRVML